MSNIFAPWVRPWGTLPILIDSGPIIGGVKGQHLWFDDTGKIQCSTAAIHHYGAGLPFDVDGRLVVGLGDVDYWDQDIPFTASGAVAVQSAPIGYYDQGLTFLDSGHIAAGDTAPPDSAPIWSVIPGIQHYQYELPQDYDVSPYVSSGGQPITGYSLVTPPTGFTIDNSGVITADGAAVAAHVLTVRATNSVGSSDTTMTWTIVLGNVPTWTTIPNQSDRENTLPQALDVKPYSSSDSGTITAYTLVAPPAGFTISNGVITCAAGTAVAAHAISVVATNGVGDSLPSVFTWTVLEALVAPVWTPIPPQSDLESALPQTLDVSLYATSNSGPLHSWALVTPPSGFTIDAAGVITVAAGTAAAVHTIVVSVSNDQGASSSPSFEWTIGSFFTAPEWEAVPPTSTSEQLLPQDYDVSSHVTSNNGALTGWTINPPVAGFSINGSGVITAAVLIEPAIYSLTVEVTNLSGTTASSPFDWEILEYYTVPQWSTIPSQSHGDDELPVAVDISGYVTTTAGPLVNWSLVTPPIGFSISASGVITVAAGTAETTHSITVRVENDEGSADSAAFNWIISDVLLPPQWSTVPAQNDGEDVLPQDLDVSAYVTTNDGALTGWQLVAPPAGFTISGAGVVTAAAGIVPGTYPLTVRVTNNSGTEDSTPFSWVIGAVFLPPQWSTVPAQSTEEQLLPVVLDVRPYVTTNHGSLVNWTLVTPPSGWTIDSSGIITVAAARPVGSNSITVMVSNDSGTSSSAAFDWDILEEPLPPQWTTVPNKQTRENLLPQTYDMKTYVSTNSGSLTGWTLLSPPSGFTIDGSGVITAAGGTAVAIHALTVRVSNDEGPADSNTFNWEIQEELLVPQWVTVPDTSSTWEVLPDSYSSAAFVTTNSGALTGWRFQSDPGTGFSIDTAGTITATTAAGAGTHSMSVEVFNNQGSATSNLFDWVIAEELLVPQWSTIPDQADNDIDLPETLDVTSYVTSNSGPLDTWTLIGAPTGFTINQSGVITCAAGTAIGVHSFSVRVSNDTGNATSTSFSWEVIKSGPDETFHDFTVGSPVLSMGGFIHLVASDYNSVVSYNGKMELLDSDEPLFYGGQLVSTNPAVWHDTGVCLGAQVSSPQTNVYRSNTIISESQNPNDWDERTLTLTYPYSSDTPIQGTAYSSTRIQIGGSSDENLNIVAQYDIPLDNSGGTYTISWWLRPGSGYLNKYVDMFIYGGGFRHTDNLQLTYDGWARYDTTWTNTTGRSDIEISFGKGKLSDGGSTANDSAKDFEVLFMCCEEHDGPTPSIRTLTSSSGFSRARETLQGYIPNLPGDGVAKTNNFAGHVTIVLNEDMADMVNSAVLYTLWGDSNNYVAAFVINSTQITVQINVNGSTTNHTFTPGSLTRLTPVDIRFLKTSSGSEGWVVWVQGVELSTNGLTGSLGTAVDTIKIGDFDGSIYNANVMVAQHRYASDQITRTDVEAWADWVDNGGPPGIS